MIGIVITVMPVIEFMRGLKMIKLLEHQQRALDALKTSNHLNLWWSTGLGKGYFGAYISTPGTLIICPSHLVSDWSEKIQEIHGKVLNINIIDRRNQFFNPHAVNIITIRKFPKYEPLFKHYRGELLIVDEAHMIKNWKSKGYKACLKIADRFNKSIRVSATFITRNNLDLFTNAFLASKDLRKKYNYSFYKYSQDNVKFKRQWTGSTTISIPVEILPESLNRDIKPHFLSESYESAGLNVPKCTHTKVKVETTAALEKQIKLISDEISEKDLMKMSSEEIEKLLDQKKGKAFKLNQLCNSFMYTEDKPKSFKYSDRLEKIKSIIESEEGKGLILVQYKFEEEAILKALKSNAMAWNGEESKRAFENNKKRVMVANFKSIGVGIRFKTCDFIIEASLSFNYGEVGQGRGRLRYVNRRTPYKIYSLILNNPLAGKMLQSLEEKESIANRCKGV